MTEQTEALKPGDIVQLKSGGPKMTLGNQHSSTNNTYSCYWFDGTELKTANLNPRVLVKIE